MKKVMMFVMMVALSACLEKSETSENSDSEGSVSNIPDTDAFQVKVNTSKEYQVSINRVGDPDKECVAESGEDVLCIIEMHELDMHYRGYTMNVALPADTCDYMGFFPYFYNIAPIGPEPTSVVFAVDDDNNIIAFDYNDDSDTNDALESADIHYRIGGTYYMHAQLFGTPANKGDDIRCPSDYSRAVYGGKNCCFGTYVLQATNDEGTTTSFEQWGGSRANCFEGPGIDWALGKSVRVDGLPAYMISNVDSDDGLTFSFTVESPIQQVSIGQRQVYAASYYRTADDDDDDVPDALSTIRASYLGYSSYVVNSSAHFQFDCLDAAQEIVARIRVVAREWNLVSELEDLLAGDLTADPDTTGSETPPDLDPGDTASDTSTANPKNDYSDWKDLEDYGYACTDGDGTTGEQNAFLLNEDICATPAILPSRSEYYLGWAGH